MTLKIRLDQFNLTQHDRMMDLFKQSHARVGLGHTGGHIKLQNWLDFQTGFAQAKDAVFSQFDITKIAHVCDQFKLNYLEVYCQANDATQFLLRPDLGRLLSAESQDILDQTPLQPPYDLLLVVSGGLSPLAIGHHAPALLNIFLPLVQEQPLRLAPIMITPRSRVAFADQINQHVKATLTVILIGERPGLTTPDSLGIYITHNARPGCTDEQRNCISNIHSNGLSYTDAANKLLALLTHAKKEKLTGIDLK